MTRKCYRVAALTWLLSLTAVTCNRTGGPPERRVLVTISKETTYITEPLRKDGYPDYVGALNERLSKGVTPENNFTVAFWKAVGPSAIDKAKREAFFKLLGISPLPADGDYFLPFSDYVDQQRQAARAAGSELNTEEIDAATTFEKTGVWHPWSRRDFPIVASWLAANEKPLSIVADASRRPRRFEPVVVEDTEQMVNAADYHLSGDYEVAKALVTRAMLLLGQNKIDAAWNDLLAVHHLARLAGQGPTTIDGLNAIGIESQACAGDLALLRHGRLSTSDAMRMLNDFDQLPAMPRIGEKLDVGERFRLLDAIAFTARNGFDSLTDRNGTTLRKSDAQELSNAATAVLIDWDVILRMANAIFDQIVDGFRQPTPDDRVKVFARIEPNLREMMVANPNEAVSRDIGGRIIDLFVPALRAMDNADDRAAMQFKVSKLGLALAAWRAERRSYPVTLDELVPKYIPETPKNVFIGADLHYEREGSGYLIRYRVEGLDVDDVSVQVSDSDIVRMKE